MFSQERHNKILELLATNGSVNVSELIDLFSVSEATVRRDLTILAKEGRVKRTHGGAIKADLSGYEAVYSESERENISQKRKIATICAGMVNENETIFLDSGTTTFEIARLLRDREITIITNSTTIVADYVENGSKANGFISTGGIVRADFRAFVGHNAESMVRSFLPDKTFVSANGFSVAHGATTPSLQEASIKKAMIESGKKVYLVVDSSKANKEFLTVIAPLRAFDAIITDDEIDREILKQLESEGITVIK